MKKELIHIFSSIGDLFFPHSCLYCNTTQTIKSKSLLCEACCCEIEKPPQKGYITEIDLLKIKPSLNTHKSKMKVYSVYDFSPRVQQLVHSFKYKSMYTWINRLIREPHLLSFINLIENDLCNEDIFVPIPLHKARLRERGYNQAEILANVFSVIRGNEVKNLLFRTRNNSAQAKSSQNQREKNSLNLFAVQKGDYRGTQAWIIDDVYTTGNTVKSAVECLMNSGIKVKGILTLARAGYEYTVAEDWHSEDSRI